MDALTQYEIQHQQVISADMLDGIRPNKEVEESIKTTIQVIREAIITVLQYTAECLIKVINTILQIGILKRMNKYIKI